MQTVDLMEWCLKQGWTGDLLDPYHADLGLSGTLRPDQRPDMLRLFDNIDQGIYDHGSVVCYQESRLFRDETQIYYNQFIQKCKDHDIVVIVVSPYTMLYDFRDDFLTEMFRWKCKEAAEFIRRQVKGWMLPARERAAMRGLWAGYGDLPMGYIVDFDSHSSNYKKFVPYDPHADIVRWLFDRYMELGGDEGKLYRELGINPVYFPVFDENLDYRNISKRKLKLSAAGYRIRTRTAVESILTNPHYIGAWTVKGVIVRYDNHEPIVARDVFDFSFNRLSSQTLDGQQKEVEQKAKRYYQQATLQANAENEIKQALLKDRVNSHLGPVYARFKYQRTGARQCIYAISLRTGRRFLVRRGILN
ncbi:recombinase family protein [Dictyobacter kobayashii]